VFGEPGPQRGHGFFGERGYSVLAAFAVAADVRAGAEMDVGDAQAGELRDTQPGLDVEQQ